MRCEWCHGIRPPTTMIVYKGKYFCSAEHLQTWKDKNEKGGEHER